MPRLLIMRHAKAVDHTSPEHDFARDLSPRGHRMAETVARHLAEQKLLPTRILCSSSERTRNTLAPLLPLLSTDCDISISRDFYLATAERWIGAMHRLPGPARTLMLIGHNPGVQKLCLALTAPGPLADEVAIKFPTGAVAVIDIAITRWSDLHPGDGHFVSFIRPADIAGEKQD